ncbi:MAG: HupE/UreJ family protein [Xanthobacteraceae bacterium]
MAAAFFLLVKLLAAATAQADELRPAFLDLREFAPGRFSIVWKVPAPGNMRLAIHVRMPESCKAANDPVRTVNAGAFVERWNVECDRGLKQERIEIAGLRTTPIETLAHITYVDGSTQVARLTPDATSLVATGAQTRLDVARTYFLLGVDHILTGFDHLLFVFTLVLLIKDRWTLLKTITAFTLAHSITLAGASLGYISLHQQPVEAAIALSIAFTARELVHDRDEDKSLARRAPWVLAFAFGLLHGFGFAGALKEIGLPANETPLALLTFNVGVETGQLIFVAAILLILRAISTLFDPLTATPLRAVAYLIGTVSMVWFISRAAAF